mgnify:FL=1|jgi:hypothetical protein
MTATAIDHQPTCKGADVVERWIYLGVREGAKSTPAKPVTVHGWKRPSGDVSFWGKHGAKGAYAPSVGQVFRFDVQTDGQPDGSDGITVWFGSRQFEGNDHDLDDAELAKARHEDRAWRASREALKVAKKGNPDEELSAALDVLREYYAASFNRSRRAAVLGWFIQRITMGGA